VPSLCTSPAALPERLHAAPQGLPSSCVSSVRVEIWSDIACPWCWVGKRHLEAAKARFPHPVEVVWRAFELDPDAPRASEADPPCDYAEALARKYRATRKAAEAMIDRMTHIGRADGLHFRFDRVRLTNTFDAHRLLGWAAELGRQDALEERLFRAYMHEGRSISDPEVLAGLAADVDLPPDGARAVLGSTAFTEEVRAEQALAREIGVTGVPFFVFGGRYAVSGAQPAELLLQALHRAWSEENRIPSLTTTPTAGPRESCDPDGGCT
jgi:predicted DsbA family dithiol-disulfide isomerase